MAKQDPYKWRKKFLKPEGGVKKRLIESDWRKVYDEYMLSPEWEIMRTKVKHRDFSMCAGKVRAGKVVKNCCSRVNLQIHHLNYRRFGNDKLSDLITLCEECHRAAHGGKRQKGDG